MRYVGGKGQLGSKIAVVLNRELPAVGGRYLEPFVGGANILHRLEGVTSATCADLHPGVIALYRAVLGGWMPPEHISESEYRFLRVNKDNGPLCTFAAFASSFGGIEWTAYSRQAGRNPTGEGRRAILKKILGKNSDVVEYIETSYYCHWPTKPTLIYCDPPYRGIDLYSTTDFDNDGFERWCETMHHLGHIVFVSEYSAPRSWKTELVLSKAADKVGNKQARDSGKIEHLYRVA